MILLLEGQTVTKLLIADLHMVPLIAEAGFQIHLLLQAKTQLQTLSNLQLLICTNNNQVESMQLRLFKPNPS